MNSQRRRVLAAGVAAAGAAFGAVAFAQPKEKVIRVTARKWVFLPREIRLRKGVPVVLEFVTADVVMGFNAPDFKVRADIIPGQVARVRLVPDKTGTFVFLCDIFCGEATRECPGRSTLSLDTGYHDARRRFRAAARNPSRTAARDLERAQATIRAIGAAAFRRGV